MLDEIRAKPDEIYAIARKHKAEKRAVEYAWSKALDYEISFNPFPKRKTSILWWRDGAAEYVDTTEAIIGRGEEIERLGVKPKDALHLASAEKANCDFFLTTDKGIMKKVSSLGKMKVVNPIQFISEECNGDL